MAYRRLTTLSSHILSSSRPTISATPLARTPIQAFKLGSSYSTSSADMSKVKELVDKTIAENEVVVFSKTYCPYCSKAKATLKDVTDDLKVLELDNMDDGADIQAYLKQLNGQGTVPHVYIRQKFIGGNSDLQKIPGGELKKLIQG